LSPFPRVDDHLVLPEVTRDEIIGGRRVVASPAHLPHATQHTRLDYVLEAHVAPGYQAATDLLTRHDEESDFATDACVLKEGRGRAESILDLLEARGVAITEAQRAEVLRCADPARLSRWLRRAALASTAAQVLEEP
jgi:hypothetical protein